MIKKNIKKIIGSSLIGLAMTSPMAFAEEDIKSKIQKKGGFENFSTDIAAEFSFEAFENKLEEQIEVANFIIESVEDEDVDLDSLNSLVDDLNEILEEASQISDFEDLTDEELESLEDNYNELKDSAKKISKNFKEGLENVDEDKKEEIRDGAKEISEEHKENNKEEMDELKQDLQVDMLNKLSEASGIDLTDSIEQLESGELTMKEIREELKQSFEELTDDEKDAIKDVMGDFKPKKKNDGFNIKDRLNNLTEEERDEIFENQFGELNITREEFENLTKDERDSLLEEAGIEKPKIDMKGFENMKNKFENMSREDIENMVKNSGFNPKGKLDNLTEEERDEIFENQFGELNITREEFGNLSKDEKDDLLEEAGIEKPQNKFKSGNFEDMRSKIEGLSEEEKENFREEMKKKRDEIFKNIR